MGFGDGGVDVRDIGKYIATLAVVYIAITLQAQCICCAYRSSRSQVMVSHSVSMLAYRTVCCSGYSGSAPNCQRE